MKTMGALIKKMTIIIIIVGIALLLFCLYAHVQIKKTANRTTPQDMPYIIVLGAKVNGDEMSLSLLYRAKKALTYLQDNPQTKVIASGGQGAGEDISEAAALKQYFIEKGIDEERILVEDQSTSTYENLAFVKELYGIEEAVITSNDFHLYRAIENAKDVGIKGYPLAAKTPNIVKWKLYIREYAAILKLKLTGD
ncbi:MULTISPECIES: YdcF family protein [unclassified Virgibacillus]|uniref:YdcF family protein n=1 Tax=unclassified Virgibacillus TaxID=2620237 RepID=UPI0024DEA890|nr:YdcF family protein [Virgibacillus sp. LDC-1]